MNKVILVGRLTKDPELKRTNSDISVANFSVAIDRKFKDQNGDKKADFFDCVAWRQSADFVCQYFKKGKPIAIVGSLQNRSWDDQNGNKRYKTEVIVEEINFVPEPKRDNRQSDDQFYSKPDSAFEPDADLPFDI